MQGCSQGTTLVYAVCPQLKKRDVRMPTGVSRENAGIRSRVANGKRYTVTVTVDGKRTVTVELLSSTVTVTVSFL